MIFHVSEIKISGIVRQLKQLLELSLDISILHFSPGLWVPPSCDYDPEVHCDPPASDRGGDPWHRIFPVLIHCFLMRISRASQLSETSESVFFKYKVYK